MRKMRVLIAEDEEIARRVVERGFIEQGHECIVAANGPEAYEAFTKGKFDMVVSDWNMPGFDGLELFRKIRMTNQPYAFLVLLTGRDRSNNVIDALNGGADHFLTKPITSWALEATLIYACRAIKVHRELEKLKGPGATRRLLRDLES